MYHKASIAPLSSTQISKILNGHSVRISSGNGHDIELSKEQLKKFARAQKSGKGMTLTMDPFQMQNHQHLRGSGNLTRTSKGSVKRLITSATDRAIRAIEGSGIGGNIKATAKDSGKRLIVSGTDRAIRAIEGSGVNRLKKAQRWEQFANATVRDGIETAGKAARVYRASTKPSMAEMLLGFGLKKRKAPRRRKRSPSDERGGALMPAGIH
jgi:DNA gyrase/topoisomerase IV subunit A